MAHVFAFFALFHLILTFFRPEFPFESGKLFYGHPVDAMKAQTM